MVKYVLLDTNILLNLYHYSGDDLGVIESFVQLIEAGQVVNYCNDQIVNEYYKNRESKIKFILQELDTKFKSINSLPRICDGFEITEKVQASISIINKLKGELFKSIRDSSCTRSLAADLLIARIFEASIFHEISEIVVQKARTRRDRGFPPGKNDSLGDQIIWETMLAGIPEHVPLTVVTDDKDWRSALDKSIAHDFLQSEWRREKGESLKVSSGLSEVLKSVGIDEPIQEDPEKQDYITALGKSGSFSATHSIIEKLSGYTTFSPDQVYLIIEAIKINDQVRWVARDDDVSSFYAYILSRYHGIIADDDFEFISGEIGLDG